MLTVGWKKVALFAIAGGCAALTIACPAFAFDEVATQVQQETCSAYNAGKHILITASVLALIIGLAPMLWGQVKTKWIVSCLIAASAFSLIAPIINMFAGGVSGCS